MGSGNIKKFEWKLGRTGLLIVISGMAALLCSSFLLGVTVGRNIDTYPEKISSVPQQVLALFWRPAKIASQQKIMANKETKADKGNMDLTFHSALTSPKAPSIQPLPVAEKKPDNDAVPDQTVKSQPLPALAQPPKEEGAPLKTEISERKVSAGEKMPAENKSKLKEVPLSPVSGAPLFVIHVASLKDKIKANQISKTIAGMGYQPKVVKVDIKGKGTWYRVTATGFETRVRAQAVADKISKKIKANCIIRQVNADPNKNP